MSAPMPSFATFWAGPRLSPYEAACIRSFLTRGHEFHVYSYDRIENLPEGAVPQDARDIADAADQRRFLIRGVPNLSHFSDLFRYRLFDATPHIWVDADMLLLRTLQLSQYDQLLAKEDDTTLCGAILRLDRRQPNLARLIQRTEALRDRELVWGSTGPRLLTAVFGRGRIMQDAHEPRFFFPVHYDASWKLLLPETQEECAHLSIAAFTTHLWNDRLLKIGVWKRFAPPAGSFLWHQFRQDGSLQLFDDSYPAPVMRAMAENWRFRCEGGDIGIGQWMRRALPSAQLTFRRRLNLPT